MAGRTPAINCQASNKAKGHPSGWPFCIGAEKNAGCDAARLILPHMPDSATDAVSPTCLLPYVSSLPEIYP
ncbi:hypothetical protein F2N03_02435 [Escherichia coli]|nr:hypothetical protein [Escherichia coli]